jgi:hypothetical protein
MLPIGPIDGQELRGHGLSSRRGPGSGEEDRMPLLTPEDFEPWVGRKVRVNTLPQPVEITLARVERRPPLRGYDVREPFSLYFEAPASVYLLDETYEFDCGRGGPHPIFIVQLMPSADRRHYQAVFA